MMFEMLEIEDLEAISGRLEVTEDDLAQVMEQYPTLTSFGFGIFEGQGSNTGTEYEQKLQAARLRLLQSVEQCSRAYVWLKPVAKIHSINRRHSSYGLKHWLERCYSPYYCSNGALIAAALLLEFKAAREGPNAYFNMSERSLDERYAVSHRQLDRHLAMPDSA
jgi:hypothetical protein